MLRFKFIKESGINWLETS